MVATWMFVRKWTPEQAMQKLVGHRNGFTVYLP
jgi:hypothetical protein